MTTHHTLLLLPLALFNIFEHLQHISLSLSLYIYIYMYILQALQGTANHFSISLSTLPVLTKTDTLLSLPLSLSDILQALTAHLSLSLCTTGTLQMTTPLLSLPLALSNIFRAFTTHLSLSRCIYTYIYVYIKQ